MKNPPHGDIYFGRERFFLLVRYFVFFSLFIHYSSLLSIHPSLFTPSYSFSLSLVQVETFLRRVVVSRILYVHGPFGIPFRQGIESPNLSASEECTTFFKNEMCVPFSIDGRSEIVSPYWSWEIKKML